MATQLQARRFHGKPLLQPQYNFRDVPWCTKDLSGSTLSVITERQHLVDSIAELTLLCNEATRRQRPDNSSSRSLTPTKKTTKPLSIEYIFDRIDTDDPIWGLMVRTDTPMSFKGRPSNLKSSPNWKRGMLQGFITMTTFTNWQSSFRFDSLHEMAFGQDDDDLEDQMKAGERVYDEDGTLAEELEALVKGGNPHVEGIVYPRIAEISLFGGLGCGKQLLRLLVEHLESLKATARQNYDYIVLQATENSIPFYESMGFVRVGCVQGKGASPNAYHSNPVEEYTTTRHGETPASIAKDFGVDAWDIVFLNIPVYGAGLVQKSWLRKDTKIFVPKQAGSAKGGKAKSGAPIVPKWYTAEENETPRGIAKKFGLNFTEFLEANKRRHPELTGHSKLMDGTRIQISRFDIDQADTIAYSHWTFPDADQEDNDPSYMMALKLNRKKGNEAKVKPVANSLAVPIQPYNAEVLGVKDLLSQPKVPPAHAPLAPIFTKKTTLKEPKKPKRPVSSYAHFTSDARSSMAGEIAGLPLAEVNKILSDKWRSLTDEEKAPYQELYEESKAEYIRNMKKYDEAMKRYKRETPQDTTHLATHNDTSLLEKVVKLKSTDGLAGASKFEYYYVLTFIPDLQWVHLIPMRKVGTFGPEYGAEACGRPVWKIVDEDENKEIDTTASLCQPVTALTMKNSADADHEEWDIYDNGEKPPAPRPGSFSSAAAAALDMPGINGYLSTQSPVKPKKPSTSFGYFCSDAKFLMKDELENTTLVERTKIIAERWRGMDDEEKQQYKDQQLKAQEKYTKAMKKYQKELAHFQRKNGIYVASSSSALSSKTPKSARKGKPDGATSSSAFAVSSKTPKSAKRKRTPSASTQKKKRGRPAKTPEAKAETTPTSQRKRGRPRKTPPQDAAPAVDAVHTVRHDPEEVETLLETLKGKKKRTKGKASPCRSVKDDGDSSGEENELLAYGEGSDVVLSLLNEDYKKLMWVHFRKLGTQKPGAAEKELGKKIFRGLKKQIGSEGKFYKKGVTGDELIEVDDVLALDKIVRDLKRRMDSRRSWLDGASPRPSLAPTRKAKQESSQTFAAESEPKLSPTRYPRRGAQPEFNTDIVDQKQSRKAKRTTLEPTVPLAAPTASPRYPRRGEAAAAIQVKSSSPRKKAKSSSPKKAKPERPLAPIFLKSYKKKQDVSADATSSVVEESEEVPARSSRYPGRKRKQLFDNLNVVSDESDNSTDFKRRTKRARL